MIEEDIKKIQQTLSVMQITINEIKNQVITAKKDISKLMASARLSTSCANPSNHGREGKMPRKQPQKNMIATVGGLVD